MKRRAIGIHCKKRSVTEHPRGAIFYCFRGNSMGYHGNSKILLPWGVQLHRVFYSVYTSQSPPTYLVVVVVLLLKFSIIMYSNRSIMF